MVTPTNTFHFGTAEIWTKYSELQHYTDAKGLKGILESQTLFATHFRDLNDSTELKLLPDRISKFIQPSIKKIIRDKTKDSFNLKRLLRKQGGLEKASTDIAKNFSTIRSQAAFSSIGNIPPMTSPFITSFCGYDDGTYEFAHGLLSQWRGYAQGGFAIIFDTRKLWELCQNETERYAYTTIMLDEVVYDDDEAKFDEEVRPFLKIIERETEAHLNGEELPKLSTEESAGIIAQFARLKHRAFREEHEVRIAACPITPERYDWMVADKQDVGEYLVKRLRQSATDASEKTQIVLFDDPPNSKLPIKRIIVGPQVNQTEATHFARSLAEKFNIQIVKSETPLVQW
ncbi:MAG: DUF2971 domain-containing protein [Rhodospirillales bacterium]